MDENKRFITFYHPDESSHYKLIPFYVVLAIYKKVIADSTESLDLENNIVNADFWLDGSKVWFKSFDFDNNQASFRTAMTSEKTMRLTEFQIKARGHSEKQIEDVNKLVQRINLHRFDSDKSFKGLLNNRRVRKQLTPQSGVIIFTNKSKFRTLFKSLSFGDVRIDDAIHTINAIWDDKKSDYVYKSISKFKEDEPLILIASYSDRYAIEDFQNRYKKLGYNNF